MPSIGHTLDLQRNRIKPKMPAFLPLTRPQRKRSMVGDYLPEDQEEQQEGFGVDKLVDSWINPLSHYHKGLLVIYSPLCTLGWLAECPVHRRNRSSVSRIKLHIHINSMELIK